MTTKFYRDTYRKYTFKKINNVIKCMASTNYQINNTIFNIFAKGKAKCSPQDKFDYNFGCELAKARAKQKLARKIEKLLENYSNTRTDDKKKIPYLGLHGFKSYFYDFQTPIQKRINEIFSKKTDDISKTLETAITTLNGLYKDLNKGGDNGR